MPSYIYECLNEQCDYFNKEFEYFHSIMIKLEKCPYCHAKDPKRLISQTNFVLSGGGWAKEGYSSK